MWIKFQYDDNNNIVLEEWYDNAEGLLEQMEFIYEDTILKKEIWSIYIDEELDGQIFYEYDNFGNELRVIETDEETGETVIWDYKYSYDEKNNWTQKIETIFKGGSVTYFIIEREIEYYE